MRFVLFILPLILFSCSGKKEDAKMDEIKKDIQSPSEPVAEKSGITGVFDVPEMICLAVKDTANSEDISQKIEEAYKNIQEDINLLGIRNPGNQGLVLFTNDPGKFVFRCVIPINQIPTVKPQHSELFILEGTRAVTYNYYGPYNKMTSAYQELGKYISDNKLQQTKAAREFYITDPQLEKDTSKWLSKIYIPVK